MHYSIKVVWGNDCLYKQSEKTVNQGAINVNKVLMKYANKHQNVYFINPFDTFCENNYCINVDYKGTPLYSDVYHLSKTGSIYFITSILRKSY